MQSWGQRQEGWGKEGNQEAKSLGSKKEDAWFPVQGVASAAERNVISKRNYMVLVLFLQRI